MGSYLIALSLFFQQALSGLLNILVTPFGSDGSELVTAFINARGWLLQTGITLGDIDLGVQSLYTPMAIGLENLLEFGQNLIFMGVELPVVGEINLYNVVTTLLRGFGVNVASQSLLTLAFSSALVLVIVTAFISLILGVVEVVKRAISLTTP